VFGRRVNFWQIWLELGSRYSGFKDQRGPAETGQRGCFFGSWAFAARANLDVFCEGRLSCPTEEKAQQLHARDECVLSISTDSLSITAEEKRCCTKPLSAPVTTETPRWTDVQSPRKRDTTRARLTVRSTLPPSSNKTQTLFSACFSSPFSYSCKPHRLSYVYTILYCLYTRLCLVVGP